MAIDIDIRALKPSQVVRLLNSTPLGEVMTDRRMYQHRMRAGYRIGDGSAVDFIRYAAWLAGELHAPREAVSPQIGYDAVKERAAARSRALSEAGRDIGEIPAVANPQRRASAEGSFRSFCEAYFPETLPELTEEPSTGASTRNAATANTAIKRQGR